MTSALETLINAEGHLNLPNNRTLAHCAFPGNLPAYQETDFLDPNISFCLQLKMVFKVVASVILVSYSHSCILSHEYKRYTCY